MYDIDFLVKVSQHKKSYSSLPSIPKLPSFSESSSQTGSGASRFCSICRPCSRGSGDAQNGTSDVWKVKVEEDLDSERAYDINQGLFESVVVKPDIDADLGVTYFNEFKNATQVTEPLASDMHCYFNCGEVFKKGYDLQVHIKLRHKGEDPVELARAEDAAKFEIALTKRSACVYKCALCNKTVEGWSSFWDHLRKHKISVADYKAKYGQCEIETARFQCRICGKVVKHETNIIHKHLQWVHGINWTQYLTRVRLELRGVKQDPLPEVVSEECKICHLKVKYMKLHMRNKHTFTKKEYCQICDDSYKYLKTHLKNKHGITGDEYDQVTSEATTGFLSHDLNQNSREYQVPDESDASMSSFSEASSKSYNSALPKPSKEEMSDKTVKHCSVCDIQFGSRKDFIDHCQVVHGVRFKTKADHRLWKMSPSFPQSDNSVPRLGKVVGSTSPVSFEYRPPPSKVPKIVWPVKRGSFMCEECGVEFTSWQNLDQHMKLECKKLRCEDCGKTYSTLPNLKKHRRLSCAANFPAHSPASIARGVVEQILSTVFSLSQGPRIVFKCPVADCGQQFGRSVHLRRHQANYHDK